MRHIPTFFFCKHTWTQIILYDSVIHTVFFYDYFLPIFFLEPSRLLSLSHPLLLILLSKTLQAISILKCLFQKTKKGHLLVTTFLKACSYKKKSQSSSVHNRKDILLIRKWLSFSICFCYSFIITFSIEPNISPTTFTCSPIPRQRGIGRSHSPLC